MGTKAKAVVDPWADHVAAMDEERVTIAEAEKALAEAPVDADPDQIAEVQVILAEAQNHLHSLELAYAQHTAYEAAHAPATISADDQAPADSRTPDKPEE